MELNPVCGVTFDSITRFCISGEADNAVISFSMSIAITAPAVVALSQFLRPVITAVKGLSINCDIDSMQGCPIWIYH